MHVRCPHCSNPIDLVDDSEFSDVECPSCGSSFNLLGERTAAFENAEVSKIGHFELVERVGMGAFGSVWKATDTELDRTVAVKIPRKGELDPAETEQFLREARSAAQLKHPNIVGVHEIGRDDGQTYIVSDFIEGLPLSSWLTGKQLTLREAASLCAKIADALHHAHEAGVIHRDLKPSNIMLDSDAEPHIMDFGLAKREAAEITMTVDGKVLGTPAYMSPEQARGEANAADRRTDVYSLGVILFEMLTGEKPFRGDYRMLIHQVLNEEPPGPRRLKGSVPRDIDTICLKCLEKDPNRRYRTAKSFADDLRHFLRGEPIRARPISTAGRVWRWCKRQPEKAGLVVATVVAVVFVSVVIWAVRNRTHATGLVEQIVTAEMDRIPDLLTQISGYRYIANPLLVTAFENAETDGDERVKLRASLALLPVDSSHVEYLYGQLLQAEASQVTVIAELLAEYKQDLIVRLWQVALENGESEQRLRAASALALYDPGNRQWREAGERVANDMVVVNPADLGNWTDALRPVAEVLIESLTEIHRDQQQDEVVRSLATAVLSEYVADDVQTLTELISYADEKQFSVLYPLLRLQQADAVNQLSAVLHEQIVAKWEDPSLDPSWRPVEPAVEQAIKAAHGTLDDRFAVCQTMPLEQFSEVVESLRTSGFRPLHFRPFAHQNSVLVAAVWTRDSRDWRLVQGVGAEVLMQWDAQLRSQGFAAVDVAGYVTGRGEAAVEHYGGVWVKCLSDAEEARIYVGASYSDHRGIYERLEKLGFPFQRRLQSFRDTAGRQKYCGVKAKTSGDGSWSWNQTPYTYSRKEYLGKILWDNDISNAAVAETTEERYQRQLANAESKLAAKSDDLDAVLNRAVAHYSLANDEAAMRDLDFYVDKNPSVASPYRYRAVLHARLGNAGQAMQDVAKFAELNQNPITIAYLHAVVSVHLEKDASGLKRLEALITQDPRNSAALYDTACAYSIASRVVRETDADKSKEFAERAVALLRQAVGNGYSNFSHIETDFDLDPIRNQAGFAEILTPDQPDRRYATVWRASARFESQGTHGMSPQENLERFQVLQSRGYRPVAISCASIGERHELMTTSVWHRPIVTDDEKEALAERQANAAVALLRMGQEERVWPLLKHNPDPRLRTWIIHRVSPLGASAEAIVNQLKEETDVSIRRALILALGEYSTVLPMDQPSLVNELLDMYEHDTDPGIHAACQWLLGRWGRQNDVAVITERLGTREVNEDRAWYVNGQGDTMIKFPGPIEFSMGSPGTEPERRSFETLHRRLIDRSFALAATEVTVKQFQEFLREVPSVQHSYTRSYAPEETCPQMSVTWYEAASYCRWLSEKEGISADQMCYPEIPKIREGMTLPADYLSRTGYRLPTEAEWEYACRAGTATRRYYGQAEELLGHYAWYHEIAHNRTWPVGSLKPSDFGLFDMHGNVWEWCQESYRAYQLPARGGASQDIEDTVALSDNGRRVLRGGSFTQSAPLVASAFRTGYLAANRSNNFGFRVARTYR